MEQTRGHIQRLQEEIERKDGERAEYQELVKTLQEKIETLEEMQQSSGEREKPADELVCIAGWSRSETWNVACRTSSGITWGNSPFN